MTNLGTDIRSIQYDYCNALFASYMKDKWGIVVGFSTVPIYIATLRENLAYYEEISDCHNSLCAISKDQKDIILPNSICEPIPIEYYQITTLDTSGGTSTGDGLYAANTVAQVRAFPDTGYIFLNWTEDGNVVSVDSNYQFIVTKDRTLIAHYVNSSQFTITAISSNCNSVSGGGNYVSGSTATLVANSSGGFVNWVENGIIVSTSLTYSFVVTGNRTLTAYCGTCQNCITSYVTFINNSTSNTIQNIGIFGVSNSVSLPYPLSSPVPTSVNLGPGQKITLPIILGTNPSVLFNTQLSDNTSTIHFVEHSCLNGQCDTGPGVCTDLHGTGSYFDGIYYLPPVSNIDSTYGFTVTLIDGACSATLYSISTINSNCSTTSGDGNYLSGSTATVSVTSGANSFSYWEENGVAVSTSPSYSFPVSGNRTLTAVCLSCNSGNVTFINRSTRGQTILNVGVFSTPGNYPTNLPNIPVNLTSGQSATFPLSNLFGNNYINYTVSNLSPITNNGYGQLISNCTSCNNTHGFCRQSIDIGDGTSYFYDEVDNLSSNSCITIVLLDEFCTF